MAALLLNGLACSGMMGTTYHTASVSPGTPTTINAAAPGDGTVSVWMNYDLSHTKPASGDAWKVGGPIQVKHVGSVVHNDAVNYSDSRGPMQSGGSRVTLKTVEKNMNGVGSASGSVFLLKVPNVKAGEDVSVTTTLHVPPNVTVGKLELELSQ